MFSEQFSISYQATNIIIFWILPVIILYLKERKRMITLIILSFVLGSVGFFYYSALLIPPYFAIFRIAKPYSLWSIRFYNENKVQKAEIRYKEYSPLLRVLQRMKPIGYEEE